MEPTLARLPFVWIKASAQYQGVACAEMLPKDMCYYSSPLDQQGLRSLSLSAFCLNRWDWESEGKKAILFSLTLPIHKHKPGLLGLRKGTAPPPPSPLPSQFYFLLLWVWLDSTHYFILNVCKFHQWRQLHLEISFFGKFLTTHSIYLI